jgi:asparagine synthase (glutamine-hydrolysing)
MGRYLHRRAIDGIVPNKVTWKPGKDMGDLVSAGPQSSDTRAALIARAKAMRERMPEAVVPLIDPAKLDRQIAQLESGPASPNVAMAIRQTTISLEWLSRWLGS